MGGGRLLIRFIILILIMVLGWKIWEYTDLPMADSPPGYREQGKELVSVNIVLFSVLGLAAVFSCHFRTRVVCRHYCVASLGCRRCIMRDNIENVMQYVCWCCHRVVSRYRSDFFSGDKQSMFFVTQPLFSRLCPCFSVL